MNPEIMKNKKILSPIVSGSDTISAETANMLLGAARWSKYLSIVAFVFIGILTILIIAAGAMVETVNHIEAVNQVPGYVPGHFPWWWAVAYIIFLLIYTIPVYYLFLFARNVQRAFRKKDGATLKKAAGALYLHFAFIGILFTLTFLLFKIGAVLLIML